MVRASAIILGIGLVILAIVGWSNLDGAGWVSLVHLLGGLWSFMVAAATTAETERAGSASPMILGVGLLVVWLLALSGGIVPAWQMWWTFAFGCSYIIFGLASYLRSRRGKPLPH